MGVKKLRMALSRIERKMEKTKSLIEEERLIREYESKSKKLKRLLGELKDESKLEEVMANKNLDEIPEEAW